jgi:hypothetical protein
MLSWSKDCAIAPGNPQTNDPKTSSGAADRIAVRILAMVMSSLMPVVSAPIWSGKS